MSVEVLVLGQRATVEGYKWRCKDKQVLGLLNTLLSPFGPSGADPDPDYTVARLAVERFGARIVRRGPAPRSRKGVYH